MRILAFVLLLSLLAVTATQAQTDPCTVDGGIHVGSPACPYQWIGSTTTLYDGSGNGLGFVGMTSQCRGEFGPGARMCKSEEVMDSDTLNFNAIPIDGCWLRPEIRGSGATTWGIDASGITRQATDLTCGQWGIDTLADFGLVLRSDGRIWVGGCGDSRPIACCKPFTVPAPTSSLSLPVGAAALAGLSMLKGGA